MDKRPDTMNHKAFDLNLLSDSSISDTQTNAASDVDASENCTLLMQTNEKPASDPRLYRIARYIKRDPRVRREPYDDDDDDDDDHRSRNFYVSSRQIHKRTIKRYLFLFGFVSTLIIFSQCLSVYNYEPDVKGLFAQLFSLEYSMSATHIFFFFSILLQCKVLRRKRQKIHKECIYQLYFSYQVGIGIEHVTRQRMYCQVSIQQFYSHARCVQVIHQYCC